MKTINYYYQVRENYENAYKLFSEAKNNGVNPISITVDGNTSVIRAIKTVWPNVIIQRCLTHVQRQGLSWLRRYPKLEASKKLRIVYLKIFNIENHLQQTEFLITFLNWEKQFGKFVESLPFSHKVYGDLQRARSLLINAWPDMFHYLHDSNIPPTTNKIEGYFSILKGRYKQHRGLSKINRPKYLAWYVYFKNQA
jgi:hypothetical protein